MGRGNHAGTRQAGRLGQGLDGQAGQLGQPNRPPHWVRKRRGAREKVRTSATASTVGRGPEVAPHPSGAGQPGEALGPEDLAYGGGAWRFSALSVSLIS